ncbi:MAG: hypothetical protein AAF394_03835 [Planctomycetota bacterium]
MRSQVFVLVLLLLGAWLLSAPSGSRQEATVQAQNHDWRAIEESRAEAARAREAYRRSTQEQFAEVAEEGVSLDVAWPAEGRPPKPAPHFVLLQAQQDGDTAESADCRPGATVGGSNCACDCDPEKIADLVADKIKALAYEEVAADLRAHLKVKHGMDVSHLSDEEVIEKYRVCPDALPLVEQTTTANVQVPSHDVRVQANHSGVGRWPNNDGLSLREHLRQKHFIDTNGFTYDELVQIHDSIHDEEGPMPASSRMSTQVRWGIVTRGPNGCPIDPATGREMCPTNRGTRPRSQNGGGWFPGKAIVKAFQRR